MKNNKLYTCICCWFKIFKEVFSEYEICPLCNWQDSNWWMHNPWDSPYAWPKETLFDDFQQKILKEIPYKIKEYKKWKKTYIRNNLWKPIDKDKLNKNHDYFPRWKFEEFHEKYPKHSDHHRKIMEEAQKYNPDEKVHLDL